ncbi:metallophosphoesterase [Ammoniphilus oxalaticus]|uniref:Metallophosphoesterase n=1 Tax=Ammoniphilus oxalaticus TaxID=66863 RepID=A0A419SHH4_9BACL|nr:lasso peptide biosynthesis PqqD family chaperone [Ammoniphilus oxalaticus]RKD23185.1 metallophosphoesterase [Ammoniphilus oxalaticus]
MIKSGTISMNQIVAQMEGNIVSDMGGEKVMLSIDNGKYYNLGEIGGDIWEQIDQPIRVEQLIERLLAIYDVDRTQCEQQVFSFLERLLSEGLIKLSGE